MNKNILIAEDEKPLQNILKKRLEKEGWNIFQAFNGRECLDILEKEKVDLVLLDIFMPVMSGIEVLGEIMKSKKYSKVKVIILTNSVSSSKTLGNIEGLVYMVKSNHKLGEIVTKIKEVIQ